MTAISFLATIIGSLLTRPTPLQVTENFYRVTRPFGFWGPMRDIFTGEKKRALRTEHRNDLLTVPFALLWQVTLFLLPMQLVMKAYASFFLTLPFFFIGAGGMYLFWWRRLSVESNTDAA